jgi:anti-anti-sigma factor
MHVHGSGGGRRVGQRWVIELIGEHDLSTAPMIVEWMAGIDDSAQLIEIDLREAEFIDSTVVGKLVSFESALAQAGRQLVIVSPAGSFPRRVLDVVGASLMLRVVDEPPLGVQPPRRREEASSCP